MTLDFQSFDLVIFNAAVLRGRWSGVEWAVWQRAVELSQASRPGQFRLLAPLGVPLLGEIPEEMVLRLPRFTGRRLGRIFHELFLMPRLARRLIAGAGARSPVFIAPAYVAPPRLPCPFVLCIYDLHVYTHARFCSPLNIVHYRLRIPGSIRRAMAIEVPTQHVLDALRSLFPSAVPRAHVRHLATRARFVSVAESDREAVRRKYALPGRYVLFIGDPAPRKNLPAALEAWKTVRHDAGNDDLGFVLAGNEAGAFRKDGGGALGGASAAPQFIGYVDDADMPALYSAASVLLYPSFDEGYGLPIAEARVCGCPVVTSAPTALEVAPDAIRCGTDADSIAGALRRALGGGASIEAKVLAKKNTI